ncbi:MAG: 50S ribosomal protein L4 [Ilumatobacter sp.]|nr:50S ribosomal protein L4 [Ilumatobacter sp.]
MSQITVKNVAGKDSGKVDLDDATFGIEPNVPVMHQVVTAQLAARRAGTQSTKTRSEVRGGGAKPYRQKGTGNARQGSIRSPQFVGGGVALGPKPRKYAQKTPKKMIGLALRSALSDRNAEGKVVVVDEWGWDAPSTKSAKQALAALGIEGKALVVVDRDDAAAALSFRNLPEVHLVTPAELNAYDVLCSDVVVFTEQTLPKPAAAASSVRTKVADAVDTVVDGAKTAAAAAAGTVATAASAVAEAADGVADKLADADDQPYGDGSHAPLEDGSQPEGFPIKGNADSMKFHGPDSPHYGRTVPEVWFATEEAAEAAGFTKSGGRKAAANEESDEA